MVLFYSNFFKDNYSKDSAEVSRVESKEDLKVIKDEQINQFNSLFNIDPLHAIALKKDKIKVALLDSGINDHMELDGVVSEKISTISSANNINDNLGHGTAIAGLIASNSNEGLGISKNIELYSVKVIQDDGKVNINDFIDGVNWAIEQNVDLINVSLGFTSNSKKLKEVIDKAVSKGIIIVASSGNTNGLNAQYPARFDNVISVGVVNNELEPIKVSAVGKIDFVAPGSNLISLDNNGAYSSFSGSSFSTALVSGLIAEILYAFDFEKNNNTYSEIFEFVKESTIELHFSNEIVGYGVPTIPQED